MARKIQGAVGLIVLVALTACSDGAVGTPPPSAEDVELTRPALEVVEEFFEAFNRGQIDVVLGMIDDDTDEIFGTYVGPDGVELLRFGEHSGRPWLAEQMAARTRMTDEECAVEEESPTGAVVNCTFQSRQSPREAVGAPALDSRVTFDLSDGLITRLDVEVDAIGPNVGAAYWAWMAENYPLDEALMAALYEVHEWTSIEHAIAAGEAEAEHVDEYAAYLDENDCPMTGCTKP